MASAPTLATPPRVCSFEPSVWNNFFVEYKPEPLQESMRTTANKLKEDVQMMFTKFNGTDTMVEKMVLIETLQRLGIDHLFQEQINMVITEIQESEFSGSDLYEVALRFRLLRENGIWVSPDVFNKFKGEEGSFNKDITTDLRGLLSLYNAAYLSVHGESALDEAISFARNHIESMRGNLKYPLSEQVKRNLQIPYSRTLKRIDAPHYIEEYKKDQTCSPSVLELAKLDFNLLQGLHQQELKDFCRWDESAIPLLPEYLKKYYVMLMNTFIEFEDDLKPDHKYRIVYCRKAESEWFHSGYIPSFEEQVKCSVISAGTPTLFVGSLVGMGDEITEEAFEWAIGFTDAVKACGEVTRFMDDLASFEHGKNKMDAASSLESYINQYHVTSEVAISVLENLVEDAWKTINQARFDRHALLPLVNRVANLTKSMTLLFHGKADQYTFSRGNKDRIHQQFVAPIPL
uniref:Uncharacterized protein n=1 Tax=Avena sativa TaxID=4498 RepID=A0ACD5ZG04_AVESA